MSKRKVIIVGCGVFGLSTAIELRKRGYSVTAFDAHCVPSPWAASNDINKVIRASYADEYYCKLALEAIDLWKTDPVFADCFFNSGKIQVFPAEISPNGDFIEGERKATENLLKYGHIDTVENLQGGEELARKFPELSENTLGEVSIDYVTSSGYGLASKSVKQAYKQCVRLGVQFFHGDEGKIVNFGETYVVSQAGITTTGDTLLICCGAANGYLMDFEGQVRVLGEFVAHLKLTTEEVQKFSNMPIVHTENGFFFPPDRDTGLVKLVVQNMRAINSMENPKKGCYKVSLPTYTMNGKMKGIPREAIESLRELIGKTVPEWLDKPLVNQSICWCANTLTMNWIVDKVPKYQNVYVCAGDLGHAYKFLPNIGRYVVEMMEGSLCSELKEKWKWASFPEWPEKWPAGCSHSRNIELDQFTWS